MSNVGVGWQARLGRRRLDASRRTPMLEVFEQTCARMNPYLTVVAAGLVLLNLICLAAISPNLHLTRVGHESVSAAAQPGCGTALAVGVSSNSAY